MNPISVPDSIPAGMEKDEVVRMALDRLTLLVGEWSGRGRGGYPTLESFDYAETLRVHHDPDVPYLTYEQQTELIDQEGRSIRKSHWEAGVIRPREDGSLELACVQSNGRVEILAGWFTTQGSQPGMFSLYFESKLIGNDARVIRSSRVWSLSGNQFEYEMSMGTTKVDEVTWHTKAKLIKQGAQEIG